MPWKIALGLRIRRGHDELAIASFTVRILTFYFQMLVGLVSWHVGMAAVPANFFERSATRNAAPLAILLISLLGGYGKCTIAFTC